MQSVDEMVGEVLGCYSIQRRSNWRLGASTSAECIARRVAPTPCLARSGATARG